MTDEVTFEVLQIGTGVIGSISINLLTKRGFNCCVVQTQSHPKITAPRYFNINQNNFGYKGNHEHWGKVSGIVSRVEWDSYCLQYNLDVSYEESLNLYDQASWFGFPIFDESDNEGKIRLKKAPQNDYSCANDLGFI